MQKGYDRWISVTSDLGELLSINGNGTHGGG
jgi:hypothetical protein